MRASGDISVLNVNNSFTVNDTLVCFDSTVPINGLSVTMNVVRLSANFMVRLLLEDIDGRNHLIAESYAELADDTDTLNFSHYCEETGNLSGIYPLRLKVYISNAEVAISTIEIITVPRPYHGISPFPSAIENDSIVRQEQLQAKVDKINAYNITHNKLWRAAVPALTSISHEKLMKMIDCPEGINSGGLEFYAGGIFEFGGCEVVSPQLQTPMTTDSYPTNMVPLTEFDWRNRHGRNWVTPVKNQGEGTNTCTAYACVGVLESLSQLYYNNTSFYNNTIDTIDLAEGDLFSVVPDFIFGGVDSTSITVDYACSHPVHDEASNHWDDNIYYLSTTNPILEILPDGYYSLKQPNNPDIVLIKRILSTKGPLVSGFEWLVGLKQIDGNWIEERSGHAMEMIGYGTVKEGMVIKYYLSKDVVLFDTIRAGHPKIGLEYFLFKNSYGENSNYSPAYYYICFDGPTSYANYMIGPYAFSLPIHITEYDEESQEIIKVYSESDIICEDSDRDGYYFWGIGPKPAHCPDDAMPESDGDDGDSFVGPIDDNGFYRNLDPCTNDTLWAGNVYGTGDWGTTFHCYNHTRLFDGDDMYPYGPVIFHNGAKVFISQGATLKLENGFLFYNAEIIMEPGSKLIVDDGSRVILRRGSSFSPPVGAIVEIRNGSIEPYSEAFPPNDFVI